MVSQIPKDLKSICRVCLLALLFYFCFKGIVRDRFTLFSSSILDFLVLCTFSFVVQFSRTAVPHLGLYLRAAEFHSTTLPGFCQGVFQTFFKKLFQSLSLSRDSPVRFVWAPDQYITVPLLCQAFFLSFLKSFSRLAPGNSRPLKALRYYSTSNEGCQGVFSKKFILSSFVT